MSTELVAQIFEICIIPLLGALTVYLVGWIKAKSKKLQQETDNDLYKKYIGMFEKSLTDAVIATNQTYVNTLKEKGEFGKEAQKEAFKRTYDAVIKSLGAEAFVYLSSMVSDFEAYLTNRIEAEVSYVKR